MRVRLLVLGALLAVSGLGATSSRAADGQLSLTLSKGFTVSFSAGSITVVLFAANQQVAGIDEVAQPKPGQYTDDLACADIFRQVVFGSYDYVTSGGAACGHVTLTMDAQQTTAHVKGKIKGGYYSKDTITIDVTVTGIGNYVPFADGERGGSDDVEPNAIAPQRSAFMRVNLFQEGGVRKGASAYGTVVSSRYGGVSKKRGSGEMFSTLGANVDLYHY